MFWKTASASVNIVEFLCFFEWKSVPDWMEVSDCISLVMKQYSKKRNQFRIWNISAIPHENLDYNKKQSDRNTWNEALFNGSVPPIDQCNRSDWTQTISIWLKDNWILSQGHLWNWSDGISKLFIRKYIHHSITTAKERDAKVTKIDPEDHASMESKSFHCYMRSAWANFQWINLKMRRQIAGTYWICILYINYI